MTYLTGRFWEELPHSSKYDVFIDTRHHHLILECLFDPTTHVIEYEDNTYNVYGEVEAVLVVPERIVTRLLLWWCAWIESRG